MTNDLSLTAEQRRITLTAWATYACFYLGRLNLSVALPTLAVTLGASRAEVGVLGTVFFWTYGIGTLVSGELGNVVRPRLLVAGGLLVVILANLVFSVQDTLLIMAILWGINGFAQSTGWSPLLRVITDHLSLPQRKRISTLFPISFQIGAAATWIIAGSVIAVWGWRAAFWISGLLLCLTLAHWWWSRIDGIPGQSSRFDRTSTVRELRHYMPLLLANALGGFVLVGSILWTPTYVVDTGYVSAAATGVVSALLPLIGILGMVASSLLVRRSGRAEIAAMQLLVAGAILILIAIPLPVLGQSLVLAVALTVLGGLAGLMTSAIPVQFAKPGRTSSTTGIFNAAFNLGGGFAGVVVGGALGASGWMLVLLIWAVALVLALLLMGWFITRIKPATDAGDVGVRT